MKWESTDDVAEILVLPYYLAKFMHSSSTANGTASEGWYKERTACFKSRPWTWCAVVGQWQCCWWCCWAFLLLMLAWTDSYSAFTNIIQLTFLFHTRRSLPLPFAGILPTRHDTPKRIKQRQRRRFKQLITRLLVYQNHELTVSAVEEAVSSKGVTEVLNNDPSKCSLDPKYIWSESGRG